MSKVSSTVLLKPLLVSLFLAEIDGNTTGVYGDGGRHDVDNNPLPIADGQVALNNQLFEKAIAIEDMVEDDDGNVRITARLAQDEMVGDTISEVGIKVSGSIIAIRNSAPKLKQDDEEFENMITFIF